MFRENDLCKNLALEGENSVTKSSGCVSEVDGEKFDEKMEFLEKGIGFFRESEMDRDGFPSRSSKTGNLGSQELTLSYLCDNSKLGFPEKEIFMEKVNYKGKGIVVSDNLNLDEKWVERDFMNLNEVRANSSKREVEDEIERGNSEKKPKLETLNLSLALPDVSLSLTASNALQNADHPVRPKPSRSLQSLAPSTNITHTTCSNDFTGASLSYSYSHPFSHNPSCSLTHNSTENYEYSVGRDDQIWNCGEGTNGSVHSRFKPVGDGVALSNHGGGLFSLMQRMNMDSCNTLYKAVSSDNISFFPSELPARVKIDTQSGDSRGRASENYRDLDGTDGGKAQKLSRPDQILREIVSESIPVMAQTIDKLSDYTIESTKEYLKNLIASTEKREELVGLQKRLERRSDLSKDTLLKCHKDQLDILVALKTGLRNFVSGKDRLPTVQLVEIFMFLRCKNVECKSLLPVDECDCKICSADKGFCSSCMCPICLKFDCASNTCSWVGCDVCSHWCHAACCIQRNLIRPGPSLKGPSGTSEMQFCCIGCGHPSEMFGFVKDVFVCCAKNWGVETLIKELDCVRKIFRGSEDFKGKELYMKAEEMLSKLENKMTSPLDACNFIIQFFDYTDGMSDFPASIVSSKGLMETQAGRGKDAVPVQQPTSLPPRYTVHNKSSSSIHRDLRSNDLRRNDLKSSLTNELKDEEELRFGKLLKKDEFDSLESIVRIKEAEARMFQSKADESNREAERYRWMVRMRAEKLEEEYTEKLSKLCLQETEERRRKKLGELKVLENSHCDYYKMKMRMQAEIAGLLESMEATKQQWV